MQKKISLQEVIAFNNTPKAKALVVRYGYNPPRNHGELIETITQFIRDYREEALEELSNIHPDRDLILKFEKPKMELALDAHRPHKVRRRRDFSNFEMADDYIDFSGADGKTSSKKNKLEDYLPMIVVAGIFALAITSIKKG